MTAPARRTRDEIAALKAQWRADGCWDLEHTEGFEAHHDELQIYRLETELARTRAHLEEYRLLMKKLRLAMEDRVMEAQ